MNINLDDIAGFDAAAEEIREVYEVRDSLRDEVEALEQFKKDICEVLEIGGNSHNDGIVKFLKANKERTSMYADDNRAYREILDEVKKYFKMTAPHWKYSDIPHFVKTAHEFALEKKEYMEDAMRGFFVDICKELGVNYEMSTKTSILSEAKRLRDSVNKQEDFTEEAASILGVHPGDLSLSDILEALRKLKREEKLDEMNCEIIASLKEERDQSQRAFSGEHSRRLAAEKYISDTFQRAAKELGMTRIPDGIDALCDEIAVLRSRAFCQQALWDRVFWESMCSVMEMDPDDTTPSDVLAMIGEAKKRLISILALNPETATWTDIYDGIKAEQKDHCNLISESYKMRNELSDTKDILSGLSNTCTSLKNERDEALHKLEELEKDVKTGKYSQSFVFCSVCDYLGIAADDATLSDIRAEIEKLKSWKTAAADHDKRRRNWVRKYKSEHERANSCDELYKKYKALYDADAPAREKLSDDLETYRSSYEAVKNDATKNRSLMNTVAQIVGTVGMHDDVTMAGVLNAKKKANHWDILVDAYGEGTMRSLLENIGIDISGDKANGLFG